MVARSRVGECEPALEQPCLFFFFFPFGSALRRTGAFAASGRKNLEICFFWSREEGEGEGEDLLDGMEEGRRGEVLFLSSAAIFR